jgi:hypothetical protein
MRGPPITVRCDCGDTAYVPYGERWSCPRCGRRWNTNQIPPEEYWGIIREMRRYRLNVVAAALALAAAFALLAIVVGRQAVPVVPVVVGFWLLVYMPRWRRRVRARARSLPTWRLRPE